MPESQAAAILERPTSSVRVTKNGNAKTLTVPSRLAESVGAEVGTEYTVRAEGRRIVYEPLDMQGGGHFEGEGPDRVYVVAAGHAVPVGRDETPLKPIDWDF